LSFAPPAALSETDFSTTELVGWLGRRACLCASELVPRVEKRFLDIAGQSYCRPTILKVIITIQAGLVFVMVTFLSNVAQIEREFPI
jgi:hypothetical protein